MTEEAPLNVTPLRIVAKQSEPEKHELQKALEAMEPEKRERVEAIIRISKFLLDNRETIHYVVAAVATKEEGSSQIAFHRMTTPIEAADLSLAIKLLDNAFVQMLNTGQYTDE